MFFVSLANSSLVGILRTIADVTDIFAIPILITPDFDILSGEFVRHKLIRVLEYCVTRVGSVIS